MLRLRESSSQGSHQRAIQQAQLHPSGRCSKALLAGSARWTVSSSLTERLRQVTGVPSVHAVGGGAPDASRAEGLARGTRVGTVPAAATAGPGAAEPPPPPVAVLSYRERPEVARAAVENIAAAFEDDPSTTYFCRPDQRVQFYRSMLSCVLDWYPDDKQLVCTLPPDAAAFVYVYPRLRELGSWTKLLRGGLAPLGCVRMGRLAAGMDASDFLEGQREEFLKAHGPFMYVSVMAVRPGRQGRGLGSALLAFICDRADAAGLHCYIEATSPRNRALYERFGFELVQTWRANPEMPYTYVLSRPPRQLDFETSPVDDHDDDAPTATATATATTTAAATADVATAAAAAPAPPLWWLQGGQQRRQRFEERRRQQRLRRQQAQSSVYHDARQTVVQYTDLDEYGWWPLRASEPGAASAVGEEGATPASATAATTTEAEASATLSAASNGISRLISGRGDSSNDSSNSSSKGSAAGSNHGDVGADSGGGGGGGGGWSH